MELDEFHHFPSLPLELRVKIYKLATLPRVVHMQEEADICLDDFMEDFRTKLPLEQLDPTLAYFAFNWRQCIPSQIARQPTLEKFGFSSSKPIYQPWEPSASTPEIPLNWLLEHPEFVWALTRKCRLYSNAPIPVLLHTCSESRAELVRWGYQLVFGTRSSEPRTWFHFGHDTLLLKRTPEETRDVDSLLSGCLWDVGQFDPADLQRVRQLALESPSAPLSDSDGDANDQPHSPHVSISTLLRLFGSIRELFLVVWNSQDIIEGLSHHNNNKEQSERVSRLTEQEKASLTHLAIEEIDALMPILFHDLAWKFRVDATGESAVRLKQYKQDHGYQAQLFPDIQLSLEERLRSCRDRVIGRGIGTGNGCEANIAPWEVPSLTFAHVVPRALVPDIFQMRERGLDRFYDIKRKWYHAARSKAAAGPASASDRLEDEELTAFVRENWPRVNGPCCSCCMGYEDLEHTDEQKKWWVREGYVMTRGGDQT